jgi:hypothetical protein
VKKRHVFIFSIAIIFALSACSKHNKIADDLEAYSQRLQSYTGIELPPDSAVLSLRAPSKSMFKQNVVEITINLREFYAFQECALNQLVAQRNTALGKMQMPSARYAYESQLVLALKQCEQLLMGTGEAALIVKLNKWTNEKEKQLPISWANLITQSDEVYKHLSSNNGFISAQANDNFIFSKQALNFLLSSRTTHPVNLTELEHHLQQLAYSPLIARAWRTQLLITNKLNHLTPLLIEYLQNNQCQTLPEKQSIEIMQNIFRKFFAENIQALAGELNKYHYQLSPLIEQLIASSYFNSSFKNYLSQHNTENYNVYKQSMQKHIELWQDIFALCDQ